MVKLCLSMAYFAFFLKKTFISWAKLGGLLLFDLANIEATDCLLVQFCRIAATKGGGNCSNVVDFELGVVVGLWRDKGSVVF